MSDELSDAQRRRQQFRDQVGRYSVMPGQESAGVQLPTQHVNLGELGTGEVVGDLEARREALAAAGYAPAMFVASIHDPRRREGVKDWWATQFAIAEVGSGTDSASFPKMPDDNTPGMHRGRSEGGNRRTYRRAYEGAGVRIRMPSAAAVKRFAAETGGTFDLPVEAQNARGQTVTAWVRVTQHAPNHWTATGIGFGGQADEAVSEAVSAVLEARRPTMALRSIGNITEAARRRRAEAGVAPQPVGSSWIRDVAYDTESETMVTRTQRGDVYGHHVDLDTFRKVTASFSPGQTFNRLVKGHQRVDLQACPKCSNIYRAELRHRCQTHRLPGRDSAARQGLYTAAARRVAWEPASTVAAHGGDEGDGPA